MSEHIKDCTSQAKTSSDHLEMMGAEENEVENLMNCRDDLNFLTLHDNGENVPDWMVNAHHGCRFNADGTHGGI